jgi:uncharacterized protein involved in exopolysaccharide biosynthesis
MEVDSLTYNDAVDIIRRRKWSFIFTFLFIAMAALAVAFLLPPVYQSSAKIMIEEQDVPHDFVTATVTSYAEQRVQAIKQRILSSAELVEIANRLTLYPELRDKQPIEQIISTMRDDIAITNIDAEVVNKKTGRAMSTTIAFALSYESGNPEKAQQVVSLLASSF